MSSVPLVPSANAKSYGPIWKEPLSLALALEPGRRVMAQGDVSLDAVCQAFAQIVDAKSPFTYNHSNGVANAAVAIARKLNLPPARALFIRHAAHLHDLGKMAFSNSILEKPGKPDDAEWKSCVPTRRIPGTFFVASAASKN